MGLPAKVIESRELAALAEKADEALMQLILIGIRTGADTHKAQKLLQELSDALWDKACNTLA